MSIDLVTWWFDHEAIWFSATPTDDQFIRETFAQLLITQKEPPQPKTAQEFLHFILLYDQVPRHLHRGEDRSEHLATTDAIALELTNQAIEKELDLSLNPAERCFLLMPWRHTFQLTYLRRALEKILSYRQSIPEDPYYRRFHQATAKSHAELYTANITPHAPLTSIPNFFELGLLCETCQAGPEILQLQSQPRLNEDDLVLDWSKEFHQVIGKPTVKKPFFVTISLSGGVDSMVASYILVALGYRVTAMMINYGNREHSDDEAQFVAWWCQKLGIPFYLRPIPEIKRTRDADREFYENFTREIRFSMYRLIGLPVVLGHNSDDCFENIFSNLKKSHNLDNLLGMTAFSEQYGAQIYRPMLKFTKANIIEFANRHKIPYLYDSTPSWSERGRMRDHLIPFLKEFDPQILTGLMRSAEIYHDLSVSFDQLVETTTKIQPTDRQTFLINHGEINTAIYWQKVFHRMRREQLVTANVAGIKSIQSLVARIAQQQWGKVNLSKSYGGMIQPGTLEIIPH